jgi:hypothetical protein
MSTHGESDGLQIIGIRKVEICDPENARSRPVENQAGRGMHHAKLYVKQAIAYVETELKRIKKRLPANCLLR